MKNVTVYAAILLSVCLGACNSNHAPKQEEREKAVHVFENKPLDLAKEPEKRIIPETAPAEIEPECARGEPEPVVLKKVFPNTNFKRSPDKLTATETLNLPSGDRLEIRHWGCESYVLTFAFETSRFEGDLADAYGWAEHAVKLLHEVSPGIKTPLDIAKGTRTLENHLQKTVRFEFNDPVTYEEGEIPSTLTLDGVTQPTGKKYKVEISFATGPL